MKIQIGDIFASEAQTIVNTINCVGVMGKGIALEFKKRYPQMFEEYKELCRTKSIKPGEPYYYTDLFGNSIINFPTKDNWRSPSKLSYIVKGLDWFRDNYESLGITSIAFPPLGCGNGGLEWEIVGPIMYEKLHDLPIDIEIYAPFGTKKEYMTEAYLQSKVSISFNDIIGTNSGRINKYWYLILYVIQALNNDKYSLSVGRTIRQKICYVLTRVGIPTGFIFSKNSYGPFSKDVNDAIVLLSNANLLTEVELGQKMIETRIAPSFVLDSTRFSKEEMEKVSLVIDLFSRVKNTFQAEMLTTILFSYDQLTKEIGVPTEKAIVEYVLQWKKHWISEEINIIFTIKELSELGWIKPDVTKEFYYIDEDLF